MTPLLGHEENLCRRLNELCGALQDSFYSRLCGNEMAGFRLNSIHCSCNSWGWYVVWRDAPHRRSSATCKMGYTGFFSYSQTHRETPVSVAGCWIPRDRNETARNKPWKERDSWGSYHTLSRSRPRTAESKSSATSDSSVKLKLWNKKRSISSANLCCERPTYSTADTI